MALDLAAEFPALARLDAHLQAHDGRMGAADAPVAIAALEEFLRSGARLGRGMRDWTARFRPADPTGALVAYLYVVTVDAATHDGRDGALKAFAESGQALSPDAARLYEILSSDEFRRMVGRRPILGGNKGCSR